MDKKINICISGGDSWSNRGDRAILKGTLHLLNKIDFETNITIISANPQKTKLDFPSFTVINRKNVYSLLKILSQCDLLLWGGGHLLQNTSSKIFLVFQFYILLSALLQKKKVVGFALGVEEIHGFFWKKLSKLILDKFQLISVRDQHSKDVLVKLNVNIPIFVTADPAVVLEPSTKISKELIKNAAKPFVVIAPRRWFYYRSSFFPVSLQRRLFFKNIDKFTFVLTNFAKVADWIIETFDYKVIFVPMYPGKEQGDEEVSEKIISYMHHPESAFVINEDYDSSELIAFFQKAKFLIGMRMHATILSACGNTPTIGLYYQEKGKSFFNAIGLSDFALPIEEFTFEKIIPLIHSLALNSELLKNIIEKNLEVLKAKAYCNIELINATLR